MWRININILSVIYRFRNQNWFCGLKSFWWKRWGFFQEHSKCRHKAKSQFSHKTSWITSTSVSSWHFVVCGVLISILSITRIFWYVKHTQLLKGQARILYAQASPCAWRTYQCWQLHSLLLKDTSQSIRHTSQVSLLHAQQRKNRHLHPVSQATVTQASNMSRTPPCLEMPAGLHWLGHGLKITTLP